LRIGCRKFVQVIDLAGRSGRARTCDPRFWRLMFWLTIFDDPVLSLCETVDYSCVPSVFGVDR
jgi:hypothetical protein